MSQRRTANDPTRPPAGCLLMVTDAWLTSAALPSWAARGDYYATDIPAVGG